MIQYLNFGLTFLALICLGMTIFYLWKYKNKEDKRLWKGINAFIFSLGFLEIYLLLKAIVFFISMFNWDLNLVYNLNLVMNLGLIPIIIILMLIGVMLFKEV